MGHTLQDGRAPHTCETHRRAPFRMFCDTRVQFGYNSTQDTLRSRRDRCVFHYWGTAHRFHQQTHDTACGTCVAHMKTFYHKLCHTSIQSCCTWTVSVWDHIHTSELVSLCTLHIWTDDTVRCKRACHKRVFCHRWIHTTTAGRYICEKPEETFHTDTWLPLSVDTADMVQDGTEECICDHKSLREVKWDLYRTIVHMNAAPAKDRSLDLLSFHRNSSNGPESLQWDIQADISDWKHTINSTFHVDNVVLSIQPTNST